MSRASFLLLLLLAGCPAANNSNSASANEPADTKPADIARGKEALKSRDFKAAFEAYTQVVRVDRVNADANHVLGICYLWGLGVEADGRKASSPLSIAAQSDEELRFLLGHVDDLERKYPEEKTHTRRAARAAKEAGDAATLEEIEARLAKEAGESLAKTILHE